MDKNLSWTSSLGDAYYNHPQDVIDAVQAMRKRAESAGTLKTTQQQTVTTQGQTIVIEPTNPQVVYVPTYDPWVVYGAPLAVYPGYVDFFVGPLCVVRFWLSHRLLSPYPWGWGFWGCNWGNRFVVFNHNSVFFPVAIPFSTTVTDWPTFGAPRFPRSRFYGRENNFDHRADRGFAAPHVEGGEPRRRIQWIRPRWRGQPALLPRPV